MKLLLTILVGIVPSESSLVKSDYYKYKNENCEYGEVNMQPFKGITNSFLRSFILNEVREIANTDCVQFYQVKMNGDVNPIYIFHIDTHEAEYQRRFMCGVVNVDAEGNFTVKPCDRPTFKNYLVKCEVESDSSPKVEAVLSCNPPRVILPIREPTPRNLTTQVVSSTLPPRAVANEESTTRKGLLSKLKCFSCV